MAYPSAMGQQLRLRRIYSILVSPPPASPLVGSSRSAAARVASEVVAVPVSPKLLGTWNSADGLWAVFDGERENDEVELGQWVRDQLADREDAKGKKEIMWGDVLEVFIQVVAILAVSPSFSSQQDEAALKTTRRAHLPPPRPPSLPVDRASMPAHLHSSHAGQSSSLLPANQEGVHPPTKLIRSGRLGRPSKSGSATSPKSSGSATAEGWTRCDQTAGTVPSWSSRWARSRSQKRMETTRTIKTRPTQTGRPTGRLRSRLESTTERSPYADTSATSHQRRSDSRMEPSRPTSTALACSRTSCESATQSRP